MDSRKRNDPRNLTKAVRFLVALLLLLPVVSAQAQKRTDSRVQKLPSAEKVVSDYLKTIGGKKSVASLRDASYDWVIKSKDQPIGTARTELKSPGSVRSEITLKDGQVISGASGTSAWTRGLNGQLRTLTGSEAAAAKLQALLDASRLLNFKKLNVLARVISITDLDSEPAYVVEFSTRGGARLRYWFSSNRKLLLKIEDEARKSTRRFTDYRVANSRTSLLEPHRVELGTQGAEELTFTLQRASYNGGIADSAFDPPRASETLDVHALLVEVGRNQDEIEKRVTEYAFIQKETDREINSKGEITKETVKVFEVFPIANDEPIKKLISDNGVMLSGERAAKETKRVEEEFLKAERDREKNEQRAEQRRKDRERKQASQKEDSDPELSMFLRTCEFISPRRERFRDRDAVVFDFRPRPGFKPGNREESLISKLVGVVWIDPIDKQVIRLEARLAESFKMAGGLLLSLRPGAALIMEQTRMAEGVWLPSLAQVNLSLKVFLFAGRDLNKTVEWSDYKHFKGDVSDYKLDAPKPLEPEKKP
jgi:outer membrane lipoprotein-sorting protein